MDWSSRTIASAYSLNPTFSEWTTELIFDERPCHQDQPDLGVELSLTSVLVGHVRTQHVDAQGDEAGSGEEQEPCRNHLAAFSESRVQVLQSRISEP